MPAPSPPATTADESPPVRAKTLNIDVRGNRKTSPVRSGARALGASAPSTSAATPQTTNVITSPYHQRRAAILFEREFERVSLSFRNRPADDPDWDATLWWTREPSRSLTLVELAKLGALVAGQHPG